MHEYHAHALVHEHQRRLRDAADMARLIQEASHTAPRHRRWALVRQRAAEARPEPEVSAAYWHSVSTRRALP